MSIVRSSVCAQCSKTLRVQVDTLRPATDAVECIFPLKYLQLYNTHSWEVLSCRWEESMFFTMIRLPEPKRVLPNSPHSSWIRD